MLTPEQLFTIGGAFVFLMMRQPSTAIVFILLSSFGYLDATTLPLFVVAVAGFYTVFKVKTDFK